MSDGVLTFADGLVHIGKQTLPGVLVSQSISCAVRYDQSRPDSMSGKNKLALGWEDATITLTLDLLTDPESDCYQKLAEINRIFKGAARKKATPTIYTVTGRHLRARGISRVVFDSLDSVEDDQDDVIQATISFVEHLPPVVKREKKANAVKAGAAKANTAPATAPAPASKAQPAASPAITDDTTNPFMAGIKAGMN